MAIRVVTRSISSDNTFSDRVQLAGYFNVSISGVWDGELTCQRSFDQGSTWFDVKDWTENIQEYGFEPERGVWYQIGFKAGGYASGTAAVRLSQ